jgi:hypothetical protein
MWSASTIDTGLTHALGFALARNGEPATYRAVIDAWRSDEDFRRWFDATLGAVPFAAYRWETPPVTAATVSRAFEMMVIDSPELAGPPDLDAFEDHFDARDDEVLAFRNLGGDATLVVPRPAGDEAAYVHLGAFVRRGPLEQRLALWRRVGEVMDRRLGAKPVWLSTAGAGVSWLHVRLDDRPKYYAWAPYRTP